MQHGGKKKERKKKKIFKHSPSPEDLEPFSRSSITSSKIDSVSHESRTSLTRSSSSAIPTACLSLVWLESVAGLADLRGGFGFGFGPRFFSVWCCFAAADNRFVFILAVESEYISVVPSFTQSNRVALV
jgi:hypothetical protein